MSQEELGWVDINLGGQWTLRHAVTSQQNINTLHIQHQSTAQAALGGDNSGHSFEEAFFPQSSEKRECNYEVANKQYFWSLNSNTQLTERPFKPYQRGKASKATELKC